MKVPKYRVNCSGGVIYTQFVMGLRENRTTQTPKSLREKPTIGKNHDAKRDSTNARRLHCMLNSITDFILQGLIPCTEGRD